MVKLKPLKCRIRDPRRPRRYLNRYILFYLDMRPIVLEVEPHLNFAQVGVAVGKLWRTLPPELKRKYEERAEKGRRRYFRKMRNYKRPTEEMMHSIYGMRPKRFISSYAYFVKKNFEKYSRRHPGTTFVRVSRELAKKWDEMEDKRRAKYVQKFMEDWRRWRRDMHDYREGHFRHGVKSCCECCPGHGNRINCKVERSKDHTEIRIF